jgi:thiamine pyrophosphokinase
VLGGRDASLDSLAAWAASADLVIAADGGADILAAAGARCDLVVGDLDSIGPAGLALARETVRIEDQDTTDCDKLLDEAWRRGVRSVSVLGLEGDRLDHLLASVSSLVRSPLRSRLVLRQALAWLVRPGQEATLDLPPGRVVSALPLQPCEGVWLTGVRWPLADAALSPGGKVSVSNESSGCEVVCRVQKGALLLFSESGEGEAPWW